MKYIKKGKEPDSLKAYRSTPNASFDSCDKEAIRKELLKEQGAICAYCMQRISNKRNTALGKPCTEIEHYKSQDVFNGKNGKPDLRLNYKNMLGVCNGNAGQPKNKLHCDKSKDLEQNKRYLPLTIDPLNPNCERFIEFKGSGRISSKNTEIEQNINIVLNLNERNLVKNRKEAKDQAITSIMNKRKFRKGQNRDWRISDIKTELQKWKQLHESTWEGLGISEKKGSRIGVYIPYCQAVIYYLDDKLRRAS